MTLKHNSYAHHHGWHFSGGGCHTQVRLSPCRAPLGSALAHIWLWQRRAPELSCPAPIMHRARCALCLTDARRAALRVTVAVAPHRYACRHPARLWTCKAGVPASAAMSGFNLLHLVTKSQPVALRPCGLPSGTCRRKKTWPVKFSEQDLKQRLTPLQYHVTQERGTESAFKGEFNSHKENGIYTCVVCGAPLFQSETKFDSNSGWPSFYDLIDKQSVLLTDDFSFGMHRVETTCSQCGAHLGHLFDDGPRPTGKRYCINSASLGFQPTEQVTSSPPMGAEGGGAAPSVPVSSTEGATPSGKQEF